MGTVALVGVGFIFIALLMVLLAFGLTGLMGGTRNPFDFD